MSKKKNNNHQLTTSVGGIFNEQTITPDTVIIEQTGEHNKSESVFDPYSVFVNTSNSDQPRHEFNLDETLEEARNELETEQDNSISTELKDQGETYNLLNLDTTFFKSTHPEELIIREKKDGIHEIVHGHYASLIFWIILCFFSLMFQLLIFSADLNFFKGLPSIAFMFFMLTIFSIVQFYKSYKSYTSLKFFKDHIVLSQGLISTFPIDRNSTGIKILYQTSTKSVLINLYGTRYIIPCDTFDEMHFIAGILSFYFQSNIMDNPENLAETKASLQQEDTP